MMPRSLWLRLLLTSLVLISIALGAAWFGIGQLFDKHVSATYERQLADRLLALAATFEWNADGELEPKQLPADPRYQQPYSGKYWQVDGADGKDLQRSRSLWDLRLELPAAPAPEQGFRALAATGPRGQQLMVVDRSLTLPDNDQVIRIAVATSRDELIEARTAFDRLLAMTLAGLGLGLALLIAIQITVGLRPLKRLRDSLSQLRRGARRELSGQWPREIAPLVNELNELLARDAATIERSRRQAADLAHGLKTPLAVIGNLADEPLTDATRQQLVAQTEAMRRQIERHLARARAVGRSGLHAARTDAGTVVREVTSALGRLGRYRELTIEVDGNGRFDGDRQDLIEMCGNLLENACNWARSRVEVTLTDRDGALYIRIDDDGPGMSDAQLADFSKGDTPLDQRSSGSGLGLAICVDIASLYGGGLTLGRSPLSGLSAVLRLPHPPVDD